MKRISIVRNTGMLFIFQIAKMLFPFITLPFLTRVLSTEAYGTVAYVKTVMSYMQIVVDFGFMLSATRDVVNSKADKRTLETVMGDTLLARAVLGVCAFFILIIFTLLLPVLRNNIIYTFLSYVVIFETIFLMDYLFRGLEIMHVITIRFIVMKIISTILTFAFVKNDNDILLIPAFDILGSTIAVILVLFEIKKLNLKFRCSGIKKAICSIRDSFVYFISNAASTSFNALSTLLIGLRISTTEVAYWSVCMQVATSIQACYTPISDGIYPEMIKTKNIDLIKKILKIFMPIVTVGCILAYFFADFCMLILGGEKYLPAAPIFRLLIPILFFDFPAVIIGWPALGAIGKIKETTISTVVSVLLNIVLLLSLMYFNKFNLLNIAIVRSFTEFSLFSIRMYYIIKYKNLFYKESFNKKL